MYYLKSLAKIVFVFFLLTSNVWAYRLAWDKPATGEVKGYIVEVSLDNGVTYPYWYVLKGDDTQDPPVEPPTSLDLDDKIKAGISYFFRVRAFSDGGKGYPTAPIEVKFHVNPTYVPPGDNPLPE